MILDSLLGPMLTDPDLLLLWVFMFRQAAPPSAPGEVETCRDLLPSREGESEERVEPVGVGGVLTMAGADLSSALGVRGGLVVSIVGGGCLEF